MGAPYPNASLHGTQNRAKSDILLGFARSAVKGF
jgi:hypothetical protein